MAGQEWEEVGREIGMLKFSAVLPGWLAGGA